MTDHRTLPASYRILVEDLIVSEKAFAVALERKDRLGIALWGAMLIKEREALGLNVSETTRYCVKTHQEVAA